MVTTARRTLDLAMSETQWQATVIDLARTLGWDYYHTHDSRRSPAGFPDLLLVRDRIIFAELKSQVGRVYMAQDLWLNRLRQGGAEVYLWRPSHWPEVQQILTRREGRAG